MFDASTFSPDYTAARARFRSGAIALGCQLEARSLNLRGPDDEDLTIDVAWLGSDRPARAVVVSSGIHGVEGYLGSAVQAALLEEALGGWRPPEGLALVFLHALNPYGYAWTRRVNEDNIDLNRNFLQPGESFTGGPEGYVVLDGLLNPPRPPSRLDPFLALAAYHIVRSGLPALKDAVAGGQYDFPDGLFYGGAEPSRTQRILGSILDDRVGSAGQVLHVDFHTGLGVRGTYKLLVDHAPDTERFRWLSKHFGSRVEPWEPEDGVSYRIRGGLGTWARQRYAPAAYDVLAAEFGTVAILRVIAALRAENQAHHHGQPDSPSTARAKARLKDVFAPRDLEWRGQSATAGVAIVQRAIEALA